MKETQDTEFKHSWRDEYLKYISGFANAKGGTLYLGVDDKGKVVGLKDDPINDHDDQINDTIKLSERQRVILQMLPKDDTLNDTLNGADDPINDLINDPINLSSFAIKLGVSPTTIKRDISALRKAGLVRRIGSNKRGYWVVVSK